MFKFLSVIVYSLAVEILNYFRNFKADVTLLFLEKQHKFLRFKTVSIFKKALKHYYAKKLNLNFHNDCYLYITFIAIPLYI